MVPIYQIKNKSIRVNFPAAIFFQFTIHTLYSQFILLKIQLVDISFQGHCFMC